jgi:ribosomal protein S5
MSTLEKAIMIAVEAHARQVDRGRRFAHTALVIRYGENDGLHVSPQLKKLTNLLNFDHVYFEFVL